MVLFDVERPTPLGELTAGGRLDGLLCVSLCPTDAELERCAAAGVAVALIDCEHPRVAGVSIDDMAGGRLAAEHLLELGHRRIAYIGDDESKSFGFMASARRRVGAASVLEGAGAELIVRRGPYGREHARTLAAALLAGGDPP